MFSIREVKSKGKKKFFRSYWSLIFVCFTMAVLFNGYELTMSSYNGLQNYNELENDDANEDIPKGKLLLHSALNVTNNYASSLVENKNLIEEGVYFLADTIVSSNEQVYNLIFSITKDTGDTIPIEIVIVLSALLAVIIKILVVYPIEIGEKRVFLENTKGKHARMKVLLGSFKKGRYTPTVKCIFVKRIFQYLWTLTIVGGVIARYAYMCVPYIVAENPDIKPMEAIRLSRRMMKGNKFKAFLFDCSFLGWNVLQMLTFGLLGLLFANPYYTASETEIYIKLREEYINNENENYEFFTEENLINLDINYLYAYSHKLEEKLVKDNKYDRNYTLPIIIMFFFTFAFIGWIWEVALFLFRDGILVNRGALYGPWLPIYGFGGVVVVLLTKVKYFKRILKNPMVSFFIIMFLCTALEYFTSWGLEYFYDLKYWDYTTDFLNINGRVCLECSLFFGFGGVMCVYIIAPFLDKYYLKIKKKMRLLICAVLILIISTDLIYSQFYPHVGNGITSSDVQLNDDNR